MNIWEQQKGAIAYAREKGLTVENVPYMYNYVPAVEVSPGRHIALCDSLFKFGGGTIGYLSREIKPDEMDEILYLAKAYVCDGIHGMSEVVYCADANSINEVLFDREVYDLWEGLIPEGKTVLEYRKAYLAEDGLEWHEISEEMQKRLNRLIEGRRNDRFRNHSI